MKLIQLEQTEKHLKAKVYIMPNSYVVVFKFMTGSSDKLVSFSRHFYI